MPAAVADRIAELEQQTWPGSVPGHDPVLTPVVMALLVGGRVRATLTVLSKPLRLAGRTLAASGLSSVVTDPAWRGRGHGGRLVSAAREHIEATADLGLFTCDRPLAGFYLGAGWQLFTGTVLVGGTREHPFPSDQFDKVTLGTLGSDQARAVAADLIGARLELYPGELDRLW